MRSRFSAFALGETEYLWRTLHPEHPDRVRGHDALVAELWPAAKAFEAS